MSDTNINLAHYRSLCANAPWLRAHLGKVVGIVNATVVAEGDDEDAVLADLRARFPNDLRFLQRVGAEETLEVPSFHVVE